MATPTDEVELNSTVFYLSTPNRDGSFADMRSDAFDPSQSLYRFEIADEWGDEAIFSFMDHPATVAEALRLPETFLQPVCHFEGGVQPGARHIVTVEPGRAAREGLRWIVYEPAMIQFES